MDTFGRKYKVSIFGESHGPAIGVVLDGVPAGIPISEQDFMPDIDRRRSGAPGTTPRKEADMPEIPEREYKVAGLFAFQKNPPSGPCGFCG